MSAHAVTPITEEEYLARDRAAEFRSEYYDGHMYAMSGGSYAHSLIAVNLTGSLREILRKRPSTVTGGDVRLRISAKRTYVYPDAMVVCGPARFADDQNDTLLNPAVVIEVLSKSTEAQDRGYKFANYRKLDSLQEYVLISQTEPRVEGFRRLPDGEWIFFDCVGFDAVCRFESVDCAIALSEIYEKVTFASDADQENR